jgi:hypothetical protein
MQNTCDREEYRKTPHWFVLLPLTCVIAVPKPSVGVAMSSMEEIELEKRRKALDKDVASLLDRYLSEMEWSIPDADEAKARQLILDEIKQAISRIEGES